MHSCDTCKKSLLDSEVPRHKCPPRFECIALDELEQFEDAPEPGDEPPTWTAVYDSTAAGAAEKFAEKHLEYEGTLRVRVRNAQGLWLDLVVTAEYHLRYDASAEGPLSDSNRWKRNELAMSMKFHELTAMPVFDQKISSEER